MGFLDKAKASLADIQGDLTKATASLGLGDKKTESSAAQPESSNSTPIDTPATSVAPSTAGAPKAKLPLAIRKNGKYSHFSRALMRNTSTDRLAFAVRDVWEAAQPDLERKLSDLLGVPWKTDIDIPYIYTFAESGYAKDNPGDMVKS